MFLEQCCNKCRVRGCVLNVHKHTHGGVHGFYTTHMSSDHNVKTDCVCFVKCPKFSPILCLVIFGESAFKEKKKKVLIKQHKG